MDNKSKLLRRLIAMFAVLAGCGVIAVVSLFSLQVVSGETYLKQSERRLMSSAVVSASRGEILDRYGRPLITNRTVFSLRFDYAFWDKEVQNEVILTLARMVQADGASVEDSLPISQAAPFAYLGEEGSTARSALEAFAEKDSKLKAGIDAPAMIENLRVKYDIDPAYTAEEARTIIGVRYEMERSQFSLINSHIFAHDISIDLVSQIKEQHNDFKGVDIEVESIREYKTTYASHLLGRVGKIFREEWDEYQAKGYSMNAIVGKDGMEAVLEEYLRGIDGKRSYETNISGNVTGVISAEPPQPGNNCILTIDIDLQKAAEESLASRLAEIPGAGGGAAVVIEVNSGEILAMASHPTYNLATFSQDYNDLLEDPLMPMFNRAIAGVYAPGSTFKVLTAIAALEENVITKSFAATCYGAYREFTQTFYCMNRSGHGRLTLINAIQKSCNVYFYEVGYRLTGEVLEKWTEAFGLGQRTGIELSGEAKGYIAGPQNRAARMESNAYLEAWTQGDDVQAAIGQSDNAFTPLQMANYLATVVNGGTRYQAHLLKTVKTYDYAETVKDDEPVVLNVVDFSQETYETVMQGMNAVVSEGGTAARVFANYPIEIGGKSGTAETGRRGENDNGVFIAFAPFDNPEIAICVLGEGAKSGSNVATIVRDILDAYFAVENTQDSVAQEYTLLQ